MTETVFCAAVSAVVSAILIAGLSVIKRKCREKINLLR